MMATKPKNPVVGTRLFLTGSYRDTGGNLGDPPESVCTVRSPSGVIATPSTYRVHKGVWRAEWVVDEPGWWNVTFSVIGISKVQAAGGKNILVIAA